MLQSTPYTLPLLLATLLGIVTGALVWRQRSRPADTWGVAVQASLAAWAGTHLLTLTVVPLSWKLFGYALVLSAMASTVSSVLGFTLYYTGRTERVSPALRRGLVALPLGVFALAATDGLHGLVLVGPHVEATRGFAVLAYGRGVGFAALLAVFWGTAVVYSWLLFQRCRRSRNVYRKHCAVLFSSVVVLTALTVPSGLGLSPHPHFVLLPMGYLLVGVVLIGVTLSVGFVRSLPVERLLGRWTSRGGDLVPLARDVVIETIDNGIVILDADGRIVDLNKTALRMLGVERAVGLQLREVARPERILEGGPALALVNGERELGELHDELLVQGDEERRWYDVTISAIESVEAEVGYVAVLHDVTERKRREERLEEREAELERRTAILERQTAELERQNERLDEFAGIVSHDLRNPLNVANGYAELLVETLGDDGPANPDYARNIVDAHDRMETIIDDALELAREGKTVTETEPVAVGDLARAAWTNVETHAAELSVVDDGRTVEADRDRLLAVFENLFRNSVEHGGPTVTVRVGGLGNPGGFFVEDDGPGIPADRRREVFERGYTTTSDGTGLGLAIVRDVARAHGWSVEVVESTVGGVRFEFRDRGEAD